MKHRLIPLLTAACAAIYTSAAAGTIEFQTGIITGVELLHPTFIVSDGVKPTILPVWDYLRQRPYSSQQVSTGSHEQNESFAAIGGNRSLGFGSAVSDGSGALEVGVENDLRMPAGYIAYSRMFTTILNGTEDPIGGFDYDFVVEPGELTITGARDGNTAHARVGAFIDYELLTPAGEFGGTFDTSGGNLFNAYADIAFDDLVTGGALMASYFINQQTLLSVGTERYFGQLRLPDIPAHGQLTIFYDMYAHLNIIDGEVGGIARLGDPTDLVRPGGLGLVRREQTPTPVPEPGTMSLLALGFSGLVAARRRSVKS